MPLAFHVLDYKPNISFRLKAGDHQVIAIHPKGTMKVSTQFHGNPVGCIVWAACRLLPIVFANPSSTKL